MELSKEQRYAADIVGAVSTLFDEEGEGYRYKPEDIDATAFFTGFVLAFATVFNRLTDGDEDLLGNTHLANRLAVQYLRENGRNEE
jgi:hypothetical protein